MDIAILEMKHEQYTQKLRRILTTLNTESFRAVPRALYVFGSYARGAPEPGDLDLLLVYDWPDNYTGDGLKFR
jgi:predicted nucleotidyltransferase